MQSLVHPREQSNEKGDNTKTTFVVVKLDGMASCGTHASIAIGITQIITYCWALLPSVLETKLFEIMKITVAGMNITALFHEATLMIARGCSHFLSCSLVIVALANCTERLTKNFT